MTTFNQISKKNVRKKKELKVKRPRLEFCPQKKGVCVRLTELAPRKPNSAKRKVARVRLSSTHNLVTCHIPGEGHSLQEHSIVLIQGGRSKDLAGVKYRVIRGKHDCLPVKGRATCLSYYGKGKSK